MWNVSGVCSPLGDSCLEGGVGTGGCQASGLEREKLGSSSQQFLTVGKALLWTSSDAGCASTPVTQEIHCTSSFVLPDKL